MQKPLHELVLVRSMRNLFDRHTVPGDLAVTGLIETAVGDEVLDLLEFSGVEPDAVLATAVNDDARYLAEVLSVHELAAPDTGDVVFRSTYRCASVLALYIDCFVDMTF